MDRLPKKEAIQKAKKPKVENTKPHHLNPAKVSITKLCVIIRRYI